MLSCMGLHASKWFKPITQLAGVTEISKSQRCIEMRSAIDEIATKASRFVRHLVPNSPTAAESLKGYGSTVSDQCHADWTLSIQNTRMNMLNVFKKDINELGWERRHCAVIRSHSEYATGVVETKTGNCAEQAFLAGIVLKATLISGLTLRGFSEKEIAKANIKLSIVELGEPGNENNDHTVCILSYALGEEQRIFVDPWVGGAIVDENDADEFYAIHIDNLNTPLVQTKVHLDKTDAVNDDVCMTKVMQYVASRYEINVNSLHPFDNYLK